MKRLLFVLITGAFIFNSPAAWAVERTTPVSVTIQMAKDSFELPERVEGKVVLTNLAPSAIPAVFDVNLFLNGTNRQSFSVAFKSVYPGVNRFSLQDFSVHLPPQAGEWRVVIKQQDVDDKFAATADFIVTAPS